MTVTRPQWKTAAAIASAAVLLTAQTACSGGGDTAPTAPATTPASSSEEPPATAEPTPDAPTTEAPEPTTPGETEEPSASPSESEPADNGDADAFTPVDPSNFPNPQYLNESGDIWTDEEARLFSVETSGDQIPVVCALEPSGAHCITPMGWDFCESIPIASGFGTIAGDPNQLATYCPGEGIISEGGPVYLQPMERLTVVGGTTATFDGTTLLITNEAVGFEFEIVDGDVVRTVPAVDPTTAGIP